MLQNFKKNILISFEYILLYMYFMPFSGVMPILPPMNMPPGGIMVTSGPPQFPVNPGMIYISTYLISRRVKLANNYSSYMIKLP